MNQEVKNGSPNMTTWSKRLDNICGETRLVRPLRLETKTVEDERLDSIEVIVGIGAAGAGLLLYRSTDLVDLIVAVGVEGAVDGSWNVLV